MQHPSDLPLEAGRKQGDCEPANLPRTVRYVKNGAGGCWWPAAKAHEQMHIGWTDVPDDVLLGDNLDEVERAVRASIVRRASATADYNMLRTFLDHPSQHLWVTFQDGCLWWCTVRDGLDVSPNKQDMTRGNAWLTLDRAWSNKSLAGRHLAMADLPGGVTSAAGFRGTVCQPGAWKDILRIIRDELDEDASAAVHARRNYEEAIARLVARLGPKDFELLVDLVLSRSGWTRIARLGGTTEGVDVEVENASTGEIAFVQVKSVASQAVLDDYIARFGLRRDRYVRMIFAVHSPKGSLVH